MAKLYRTYLFKDKDPEIDQCRTAIQDEGLFKRLGIVAKLSGMSTSSLNGWFHGDVKSPRNSSINAVMSSLGYERSWNRVHKIDLNEELEKASVWAAKQKKLSMASSSRKDERKGKAKKG